MWLCLVSINAKSINSSAKRQCIQYLPQYALYRLVKYSLYFATVSSKMRKFANLHIFYHPLQIQSMQAHIAETEIANICPLHQASFIFLRSHSFYLNVFFSIWTQFNIALRSFCTSNVVHLIFDIVFFRSLFISSPFFMFLFAFNSFHLFRASFPAYITNFCGFILSNSNHSLRISEPSGFTTVSYFQLILIIAFIDTILCILL